MNGKFLISCKKEKYQARSPSNPCEACCWWAHWGAHQSDKRNIPRDVPKGHLAVYVGQHHKRHIIKVSLLKHPLFQALLDQAREAYGFTPDSRLCIPCDENVFLSVVQCARSPSDYSCGCL